MSLSTTLKFKCIGNKEDLQSLFEKIKEAQIERRNKPEEEQDDYGSDLWIGDLLKKLGLDPKDYPDPSPFAREEDICPTIIIDYDAEKGFIELLSISPNAGLEMKDALESVFHSLKIFYQVTDEENNIYWTNDLSQNYFSAYFIQDFNSDEEYEYFKTLDELAAKVSEITGNEVHTIDEIAKLANESDSFSVGQYTDRYGENPFSSSLNEGGGFFL